MFGNLFVSRGAARVIHHTGRQRGSFPVTPVVPQMAINVRQIEIDELGTLANLLLDPQSAALYDSGQHSQIKSAGFYIPKSDPNPALCDHDASFNCGNFLGVADGVCEGGPNSKFVAQSICDELKLLYINRERNHLFTGFNDMNYREKLYVIIARAHENAVNKAKLSRQLGPGSTTISFGFIQDGVLYSFNLGDSGFMVLGENLLGEGFIESKKTTTALSDGRECPAQINLRSAFELQIKAWSLESDFDSQVSNQAVFDSKVFSRVELHSAKGCIVFGTDGLRDNVFGVNIFYDLYKKCAPQNLIDFGARLMAAAYENSGARLAETPFSQQRSVLYQKNMEVDAQGLHGGKPDDIMITLTEFDFRIEMPSWISAIPGS